WDRAIIPDPDGFLKEVHNRGIAVTLSDHPADGVRDHDDTYPEFIKMLEEAGYRESVPDVTERISEREKEGLTRGVKNFRYNAGSKAYMDAFFKSTLDRLTEQGVDFWWIDWQQDYLYPQVNGIKGLTHLQWLNHLYYERSKKGGKRGQAFSRWAGWGDQKHPGAFSGDITTDWSALKYEIQMTVSAGNAGCFWWTHDIGGFADVVGHQAEIYCRWVQFGALSAALRTHSCGEINGIETDRRPWKWGEPFCCAMREAFHLRSRLMPYLYSVAYQSQRDSLPLLRPLYLDMPECEEAYRHPATYKFGDGLFVAPVCEAGKGENYEVTSEIWLPEGQWYSFFTGESYDSGKHCVCDSLFTFPLFAKAGYPIVLQPYQKRMTSSALSEPTVRIYAGRGDICGRTELFEDDGISDAYENGKCRLTEIVYNKEGNVHTVGFTPSGEGYEGGADIRTTLTVELYDTDEPLSVSEGELSYDAERRLATVRLYNIPSDRSFSIVIK
ncbi:MAG: glycoside hydrolase family 31 protein, partial [Clostridia bacterium]|nr:glycoside hydrolase family 31 protein [Clostridia bacterium]